MQDAAQRLIADIREIGPRLAKRGAEIEAARRMPLDIIAELKGIGLFRIVTPKRYGGLELTLPESIEALTALSAVDGSIGWVGMINSFSPLVLGQLPPPMFDEIYTKNPDVMVAGSATPAGTAEVVPGGFKVTGRWPFASGCQHSDWLFGFCITTKDGKPVSGPAPGAPVLRAVIAPAKQWLIEDTWHAEGLKGTGSTHIALKDVFVPEAHAVEIATAHSKEPGPLFRANMNIFAIMHGAPAVGLAQGAIEDLVTLADAGKRPNYGRAALRDNPLFQYELGRAVGDYRAAQALLNEQVARDWRDCLTETTGDLAATVARFHAAVWITETCVRAVETCYRLGGGSAVYESSPLQRRMRDINAAAQHMSVHMRHNAVAGALRLGHPPVHPLFGG